MIEDSTALPGPGLEVKHLDFAAQCPHVGKLTGTEPLILESALESLRRDNPAETRRCSHDSINMLVGYKPFCTGKPYPAIMARLVPPETLDMDHC
jgi:hypothetical protein